VLVQDSSGTTTDLERTQLLVRAYSGDTGVRPIVYPPQAFWYDGDVILSTNQNLIPIGATPVGGAADAAFDAQLTTATSTTINAGGGVTTVPYYVFVRVRISTALLPTPAAARGIKITAVVCAPSTGFTYPVDWDDGGTPGLHVAATDDSPSSTYFTGPLATNNVYIARLLIPTGSDFTSFMAGAHGCIAVRVTATNDIDFARAPVTTGQQSRLTNVMQRNLTIA
jgi:hypothetical protein